MKREQRPLPPVKITEDGESFETTETLPFRMSLSLIGRALVGISIALHRIADTLEKEHRL